MILPIGLDEARVSRLPWISIVLLALNVAVFAGLAVAGHGDDVTARLREVVEYWQERPYLEVPPGLERRFGITAETLATWTRTTDRAAPPSAARAAEEQAELERLTETALAAHDATPQRRLALVPARGLLQPGWLTHLFVHGGLFHLLGNMLVFFLVVAPFLEDAWGRPFFLAFYLAGGLVAGLAQALPMHGSETAIVGASGAISACLGAFALRFAHRRVRLVYWFFLVVRGTFFVPAWLYAFFGMAMDLLGLAMNGTGGGVAYGAHVGGFAFGLVAALGIRASGLDARLTPEGAAGWSRTMGGSRAADALAGGRTSEARALYEGVLRDDPDDPEALLGVARIAAATLDRAGASAAVERLLARRIASGDADGARALLAELGTAIDPAALRPATSYRAAELAPDAALADALDEAAAAAGGAIAAKALLRASERVRGRDPAAALARAERAAAQEGAPPELRARAAALAAALRPAAPRAAVERFAAIELPSEPAEVRLAPGDTVRVVHCRLLGASDAGLDLATTEGRRTVLPAARVAAIASGVLATHALAGELRKNAVLLDLLLHPADRDRGRVVVRIPGQAMALAAMHPGVAPREAFGRVVDGLLAASGATATPSRDAAAGRPFARFEDAAAFEAAAWGRKLSG